MVASCREERLFPMLYVVECPACSALKLSCVAQALRPRSCRAPTRFDRKFNDVSSMLDIDGN